MSSNDGGDERDVSDVTAPRSRPGRPAPSAQRGRISGRPAQSSSARSSFVGAIDPLLPTATTPIVPTETESFQDGTTTPITGTTPNGAGTNGAGTNGSRPPSTGSASNGSRPGGPREKPNTSNSNGSSRHRSAQGTRETLAGTSPTDNGSPRPVEPARAVLLAPPAVPTPVAASEPGLIEPAELAPADVEQTGAGSPRVSAGLAQAWSFKRLKSAILKPSSSTDTDPPEIDVPDIDVPEIDVPQIDVGLVRTSPITSPIPVQPAAHAPPPSIAAPAISPPAIPRTLETSRSWSGSEPMALMPEHPPYVSPTAVPLDEVLYRGRATPLDPSLDPDRPQRAPRLKSVHVSALRRPGRPRLRRVTRIVRHIDPWSVFKVALCFSLVLYGVCLTAGVLLWNVAYTTGTIDNIQRFFESFGWDTFRFKGGELFHNAWIAGLFCAIGLTGLIVLAATLFNLITDLVGGIRVSVLEEEVIERDPSMRRSFLRRRSTHTSSTVPSRGIDRDGADTFGAGGFGRDDDFGSDGFRQLG